MSLSLKGNAVAELNTLLTGIVGGVQAHTIFPGPLGERQAVAIALGDMTQIPADAYVVPHFNGEASLGGVGAAVARRGGLPGIQSYEQYLDGLPRRADGRGVEQAWGEVKTTRSGGGLSTYLLNAVSVGSPHTQTEAVTVGATAFIALKKAQQRQMDSVVLPALGTGILGQLSDSLSAYSVLYALETFRSQNPENLQPRMVTIAIYGSPNAYEAWCEMLRIGPTTDAAREIAMRAGGREFDLGRWEEGMADMDQAVRWADERPQGGRRSDPS